MFYILFRASSLGSINPLARVNVVEIPNNLENWEVEIKVTYMESSDDTQTSDEENIVEE